MLPVLHGTRSSQGKKSCLYSQASDPKRKQGNRECGSLVMTPRGPLQGQNSCKKTVYTTDDDDLWFLSRSPRDWLKRCVWELRFQDIKDTDVLTVLKPLVL